MHEAEIQFEHGTFDFDTAAEFESLNRSQIATGLQKHRDPRYIPFAFTEHGAIMAANVLSSPRAIEMSVHVARAFIRLREAIVSNQGLWIRVCPDGSLTRQHTHILAQPGVTQSKVRI